MSTLRYVFWDSDNTLVDTAAHHWRKHEAVLARGGIVLDEKFRPRIYRNNGEQNWAWLHEELGLDMPLDDYLNAIDSWYFEHIHEIAPRPGIPEAITLLAQKNIPQAVVSNGRRRSVLAALEAAGIAPHMAFILCKEDYDGRKPDPAPYRAALKKMEEMEEMEEMKEIKTSGQEAGRAPIDPQICLAVEDDMLGVQSAQAAGMQVLHRAMGDENTDGFLAALREFITGRDTAQ